MAGLTHSNDTTGKDKRANGFRHFFNTEMSGAALGPVLKNAFGSERVAYHLTADYTWGWSQEGSIKKYTEQLGWQTSAAVRTPLGAGDFSQYITPVLTSGADVLVLNHYGRDMVNSLTQAVQFGLRDKQVNGKDFAIVVPLYSRLMAQGAGENVKGIFGSTNWHWSLPDEGSKAFVRSFGQKYGFPPSQAAHTTYCQAILYADACERAGSIPSVRGRSGARGLQVRRARQRSDRVPRRRPPVLQGRPGGEGQGGADLEVRRPGSGRDHAARAGRVSGLDARRRARSVQRRRVTTVGSPAGGRPDHRRRGGRTHGTQRWTPFFCKY